MKNGSSFIHHSSPRAHHFSFILLILSTLFEFLA